KTPAESMLPGHLLTALGPAGHVASVGLLLAAGLGIAISLLVRPPRDVPAAAWRLAVGLTLMFLLGPQVRFGYFIYPLGLAGWPAPPRACTAWPRRSGTAPARRSAPGARRRSCGRAGSPPPGRHGRRLRARRGCARSTRGSAPPSSRSSSTRSRWPPRLPSRS